MAETENNNKFKMQFIDKFIISMIGVANVIVIIITIISVNRNYQKMREEQLKKLDEIPYNENIIKEVVLNDNIIRMRI